MFYYFHNALPRVTNALPYALLYYNKQFLQNSTNDLFLSNIRCIAVHVTMHFERNKYIFVPFSPGYHALPSIIKKANSILLFQKFDGNAW